MTATEVTAAKAAAKTMAIAAGKFDPSKVDKIVFTQNGVEVRNRRRRAEANGPITITVVFKIGAGVNLDAALAAMNTAIAAGSVTLEIVIDGNPVSGKVTKAATKVAEEYTVTSVIFDAAATVSANMVTALVTLTVAAAAW